MEMARKHWIDALIILLAILWKLLFLAWDVIPFNADEAVVGLMARHILQGERPIFFYGQAYMGSLDAYLVAGLFAVLGQSVLAIRVTQVILYVGIIITTIGIARMVFRSDVSAWTAAFLLAVPAVNTTLYSTASLGGYGEALLIGNLIVWSGFRSLKKLMVGEWLQLGESFLMGILIGLGLWANGLTLIYSVPVTVAGLYLVVTKTRPTWKQIGFALGALGLGFGLGSLPWWVYAAQNGLTALIAELTGKAVAVETQSWLATIGQHAFNLLVFGLTALLGFRPPWEVRWLALPLIPVVLGFWAVVVYFWVRKAVRGEVAWALRIFAGITACLVCGFLFTPFGVDPSGRYFLPLAVLFSLVAGYFISTLSRKVWRIGLVGLVMVFQGWGTLSCAVQNPPGLTTQFNAITVVDTRYQADLIRFLMSNHELRGYTNYWVAYPLAFLTDETIIFSPRLPYHSTLSYTERDDRYPVYTRLVEDHSTTAFITTHNPALDQALRRAFSSKGITWREERIGDYQIFYQLSKKIRPDEINLDMLEGLSR